MSKPEQRNPGGPARRRAVHIAEVAKLAGVSTATVSRALSAPDKVKPKTRARVLEVKGRKVVTDIDLLADGVVTVRGHAICVQAPDHLVANGSSSPSS